MIKKYLDKLPYKKEYIIAAFVIWNLLFIPIFLEFARNSSDPNMGMKFLPPLIFAFLTTLVIIISKKIQKIILKNGKTFKDIKKDVFLILAISTIFLVLHLYNLKTIW